ncbi:lysosome-associated membrane glycoprotein 1 [Podarcis raffonei]|uniref:lysosome-associated membrane glycoprotein 1 n=1 Tax=Podarcis raffonei TaxID=65483 RepID=UPI0023292C42|nr:lysosome-associated membrane glycoprotein 1 [Podarcis raffonei]
MASRYSWGFLLAAALLGFLQASSAFEVRDGKNKTCILANFSVLFTVEYNTKTSKEVKVFSLPSNAVVLPESTCGKPNDTSEVLAIGFSNNNSLKMAFVRNADVYVVRSLTFTYNLSDASLFPNSNETGARNVSKDTDIRAGLRTTYTCHSNNTIISMKNVTVLLSNVTLEAYLVNNTFSGKETVCSEDKGSTTAVPATTSVAPTAAPTAAPKTPDVGRYNLTGCLLASMGLQLNITYTTKNQTKKWELLNLPANTTFSGHCGDSTVTLNLTSGSTDLVFYFEQNSTTDKYFLHRISVSTSLPPESIKRTFKADNDSLSALKATVGKSYKCFSEESIWISNETSLNIFNAQVQAFKITGNTFGTPEECPMDENNMLIPIIVGAALAGLVLIVLIAYLIGRKRSHAGYQTI